MFGRRGGQPLQRDWEESSDGGASIESSSSEDEAAEEQQLQRRQERHTSCQMVSSAQRTATTISSVSEQSDLKRKKENIATMERIGTLTLFRSAILPVLNILVTCALIGVLIYIYVSTDGQSIDYTMSNITPSTLISLIMTILALLLGGGIAFALSEYKWLHFQRKDSSLALLDTYDACARGVGGALRVLPYLRFDIILITAIIFNLGLIAMGPAAQSLLHTADVRYCVYGENGTSVKVNHFTSQDLSTYSLSTNDPRTIRGIKIDYVLPAAIQQVLTDAPLIPAAHCPFHALNCTYFNIAIAHTEAQCTIGSINTTQIVDIHHNNLTTVWNYLHEVRLGMLPDQFPLFFYHGSMLGRTYYDLMNLTFNEYNSDNTTYDPAIRQAIGEQKFVMLTLNDTLEVLGEVKDLVVRECTLNSYVNNTDIAFVRNETLTRQNQTLPVILDYDQLGNTTFWATTYLSSVDRPPFNYTPSNAYAYQISILKAFIIDYDASFPRGSMVPMKYKYNVDEFLRLIFRRMGLNLALMVPYSAGYAFGGMCYEESRVYQLNRGAYFALPLVLLVPLVYWVLTWIVSLHQVNGVSRGQSQVALLITGVTAAVREQMQGLSYSDQYTMLSAANKVAVRYGERTQSGSAKFGLPEEITPIAGGRRMSI